MSTREQPPGDSEKALRELFAHAKPRPVPPEGDAEAIRQAVFAEWNAVTGRRIFVRRAGLAAAAAVLASVAALLVLDRGGMEPGPLVATVERVQGDVEIEGLDSLRAGAAVAQNARIVTHSGQVALRLTDGASLRLAPRTELTLVADAEADLEAGALYFDSGDSPGPSRFAVRTPHGRVRDIGTQFVARLDAARLEIGVRDGRVELARRTDNVAADAGERVIVPPGSGAIRRETIDSFGAEWAWAERLAPPFAIEGRHPIEFLEWVAHETGRTLVFADAQAERIAREGVLSGTIDLEPMQKLAAVMATIDLDYTIDGERIVVRTK